MKTFCCHVRRLTLEIVRTAQHIFYAKKKQDICQKIKDNMLLYWIYSSVNFCQPLRCVGLLIASLYRRVCNVLVNSHKLENVNFNKALPISKKKISHDYQNILQQHYRIVAGSIVFFTNCPSLIY